MKNTKKDSELIEKTDRAISELVYPKYRLQKAYNYYNCKRDAEQYRYLEENFGLGQATSVEFIPLIRKHVDALVGEFLGTPIIPKVSCKDSETISNISREKEISISSEVYYFLQAHLQNAMLKFVDGQNITDTYIEKQLQKLISDLDQSFTSQYEIAAQNVVEYIMQSRNTDMITKLRTLLLDLLITGYTFYRVKPSPEKTNVAIEVLNPLNTFIDRNPESIYIKDSYRVVVRKWLTKAQILNCYGRELSKDDIAKIKDMWHESFDTSHYYVRSFTDQKTGEPLTDGLDAGREIVPGFPDENIQSYNYKLIPVYEVEWTETDKDFVMQRYETVRIGQEIYILKGESENVIRSKDNPAYCGLSVNGVYFNDRNNEPFSLVLACANLQDKYDLLHFFRDNLIANSGTAGDWLDLSVLPTALGVKLPERIQKWIAYKKSGVALIDTSQEGRQFNNNTTFSGFDDTVKAQTIQGIQLAIEATEQTTSSITGVFRERLNGIQQKDAVTNVQTSLNNSFIITKKYYQQMDLVTNEMLLDCLNIAKIVYKNGLTGTLILGDKFQKVFTALPEHFTLSDFDIHIITSTDVIQDMEAIRAVIPEFIKAGNLDPSIIFEALTAKSLTELKYKAQKALSVQKEENNQAQQLAQQNEQLQQQVQQLQQQLQQAQTKLESLNEAKLQLEQQKVDNERELGWFTAKSDARYKTAQAENNTKRTEVEVLQLYDNNPYNDKIKQV